MRKRIAVFLVLLLFVSSTPVVAYDAEKETQQINEDFYVESFITIENLSRASGTVNGTKTKNYKSGNTIVFSVSVTGTFSYDGSHATCTNATANASSKNTNWKIVSKNASKSGNTALATVTVNKCVNNVPVNTIKESVALSCDANGNLY